MTTDLPTIPYPTPLPTTPNETPTAFVTTSDKRTENSNNPFYSLLGGEHAVLQEDLERNPDRYDGLELERLETLLSEMTHTKELTDEDRNLLAAATIEYATAPKTQKLEHGRKSLHKAMKEVLQPNLREIPMPEEVPDTDMQPFWWL